MKKLTCMFTFFVLFVVFLNSCNSKSLSLPDGVGFILAYFNNLSTGPANSFSYELELDLNNSEGSFVYRVPANNVENYIELEIILNDDDIEKIKNELNKVRFKECKSTEMMDGLATKVVQFLNKKTAPVLNSGIQEADENMDTINYVINTDSDCFTEDYHYYFTSSYKSLYDLFIEIIDSQSGSGELPQGWQDKI